MSDHGTDILGGSLSYTEQAVLEIHTKLQELVDRGDLAPCVEANARHALAATWQIVTSLNLDYAPVGNG